MPAPPGRGVGGHQPPSEDGGAGKEGTPRTGHAKKNGAFSAIGAHRNRGTPQPRNTHRAQREEAGGVSLNIKSGRAEWRDTTEGRGAIGADATRRAQKRRDLLAASADCKERPHLPHN